MAVVGGGSTWLIWFDGRIIEFAGGWWCGMVWEKELKMSQTWVQGFGTEWWEEWYFTEWRWRLEANRTILRGRSRRVLYDLNVGCILDIVEKMQSWWYSMSRKQITRYLMYREKKVESQDWALEPVNIYRSRRWEGTSKGEHRADWWRQKAWHERGKGGEGYTRCLDLTSTQYYI